MARLMTIHLIQRSIAYESCLKVALTDDTLVLMGEGVMAVLAGAENCLATRTDVIARAVEKRLPDSIQLLSDQELVVLCAQHAPIVSWNRP